MLIDSHCHLHLMDLTSFDGQLENVLSAAAEHQVEKMLCVCVELKEYAQLQQLSQNYPNLFVSVGIHPCGHEPGDFNLAQLQQYASWERCIAIGETGLDYYHVTDLSEQAKQRQLFATHIQASIATQKPLIIHTRQAAQDTLDMMRSEQAQAIGGVMHCFTETWEVAKAALDLGFYISFAGIITFKNATALREVLKKVPMDRILIETDTPYLAPVPYRGQQNHPGLVKYVAQMVSEVKSCSFEEIAQITTENFYTCFRIKDKA